MLRHTHVLGASGDGDGDGDGGAAGGSNDVAGKAVAVFCTVPVCPDAPQRTCCVPVPTFGCVIICYGPSRCVLVHPSTTTSQYVLRRPGTFWYVLVRPGASRCFLVHPCRARMF